MTHVDNSISKCYFEIKSSLKKTFEGLAITICINCTYYDEILINIWWIEFQSIESTLSEHEFLLFEWEIINSEKNWCSFIWIPIMCIIYLPYRETSFMMEQHFS